LETVSWILSSQIFGFGRRQRAIVRAWFERVNSFMQWTSSSHYETGGEIFIMLAKKPQRV